MLLLLLLLAYVSTTLTHLITTSTSVYEFLFFFRCTAHHEINHPQIHPITSSVDQTTLQLQSARGTTTRARGHTPVRALIAPWQLDLRQITLHIDLLFQIILIHTINPYSRGGYQRWIIVNNYYIIVVSYIHSTHSSCVDNVEAMMISLLNSSSFINFLMITRRLNQS